MKMKPLDKTIKIYDGWMSEKDCKMFVQIYKNLQKGGYTGKRRNFDTAIKESVAEDEQVALHEAIYEHGDHEIPEGTNDSKGRNAALAFILCLADWLPRCPKTSWRNLRPL